MTGWLLLVEDLGMAQQMSCGPWQLFKDQQGESERSEGNVCQPVRYLGTWCIIGLVG
jgi:hypothetical protein